MEIITFLNFPGKKGQQVGRFWIQDYGKEIGEENSIAAFGFERLSKRG